MDILARGMGRERRICIEKEVATGWVIYVMRVDGVAHCASKNVAPMPRSFSDPIQTDDLVNKRTFSTHINPAYKNITIVPGLKLEYQVYDGETPDPIAKMERTYKEGFSYSDIYYIFDKSYEGKDYPYPRISIETQEALAPAFLQWLPENDVCISVCPDKSFIYDSRLLVEERYVVSIAEQHLQWLPHVFHAYQLGHTCGAR